MKKFLTLGSKNIFKLILISEILFLLLLPAANSYAYYDDVHYAFTYYAARAVGYTPQQSHRIASAAVMIDYDSQTEPVREIAQVAWLASRVSADFVNGNRQLAIEAQQPRIDFHAFMDCLSVPLCLGNSSATAVIPQKRAELETRARESGNPGSLLHFVQDEVPHAGYPSDNGHWSAMDASIWNWGQLPLGATTDFISYADPSGNQGPAIRNRPTAEKTMQILKSAMSGNFRNNKINQKPRNYDWSRDIMPAFQAMIRANPKPAASVTEAIVQADRTDKIFTLKAWEFYKIWKGDSAPSLENGIAAINEQLANTLKTTDRIPGTWLQYDLDERGIGTNPDEWTLWGNLKINVSIINQGEEIGKTPKPIIFTVFPAPTYQNQKEEEIVKVETREAEPLMIHNLPIGDVIVEMRYGDREPQRKNVALTGLERDIDFTLDLDAKDEQSQSLDDLLLLLDKMKELEKKSNERATTLEVSLSEFEKAFQNADGQIGAVINEYMAESDKLKAWRAEIMKLEAAAQNSGALFNQALTGKQKALDAETAAGEFECPPLSVIEEGTEEEKKAAIEKAKISAKSVKPLISEAEAGASQAKDAADRLAEFQAISLRISGEIQSAGGSVTLATLTTAGQSIGEAMKFMDELLNGVSDLEVIKTNADEIMKAAQEKIKILQKDKNLKSKVDDIAKQIDQSYKVIVSNYEKWKKFKTEPPQKIGELKAQKEELETKSQALSAEIQALNVPVFDEGSASADADTAKSAAASVQNIAQRAEECPDQLAGVEIKQKDRITGLEVELNSSSSIREDGTREYLILAKVTAETKEQIMVTCRRSDLGTNTSVGQVGGLENYKPDLTQIELGRIDMKAGDSLTVSCYLPGQENRKVSKTVEAEGENGQALLERIQPLESSAKEMAKSTNHVSDQISDEAGDLIKEFGNLERDAGQFESKLGDYAARAASLPGELNRAINAATSAQSAVAQAESAAADIQTQSGEVCRSAEAVNQTDFIPDLQNYGATARSAHSALGTSRQSLGAALESARSASAEAESIYAAAAVLQSEFQGIPAEIQNLLSALEQTKQNASSLSSRVNEISGKKAELQGILQQAQTIVDQASTLDPERDKGVIRKIQKSFEKIQEKANDVSQHESEASAAAGQVSEKIASVESQISSLSSRVSETQQMLAEGGNVSELGRHASDAKAAYERTVSLDQSAQVAAAGCESCLQTVESIVAQKTSPEAQVARHDCSQIPNTQAVWNAAAGVPECACVQGYEPGSDGSCQMTVGETLRRTDCSPYPGSTPMWNSETRQPYCGCLQGYQWNAERTACVVDIGAKLAEIDCSGYANTQKYWDAQGQRAICVCNEGYEWHSSGTWCMVNKATQVAQANCSHVYGTSAYWDENTQSPGCTCPPGQVIQGNACVTPAPPPQAPQNLPPQNNPDWQNTMNQLTNAWNQGVAQNTPPPPTYTNPPSQWNDQAAQFTALTTGSGSGGGTSNTGGGTPAGFTGFGGNTNTGSTWTNTGYTPPPNNPPPSPGVNTGPGSWGAVTPTGGAGSNLDRCTLLGQDVC